MHHSYDDVITALSPCCNNRELSLLPRQLFYAENIVETMINGLHVHQCFSPMKTILTYHRQVNNAISCSKIFQYGFIGKEKDFK